MDTQHRVSALQKIMLVFLTCCIVGGLVFLISSGWLFKIKNPSGTENERVASANNAGRKQRVSANTKKAIRPYSHDSPWNLRIGPNPNYDPDGPIYISEMDGIFGANPNMYATPVYYVTRDTPIRQVILTGWYSNVIEKGQKLIKKRRVTVEVPIPSGAEPARGKDSHIVLWNTSTGNEWGFWKAQQLPSGNWTAKNGYHYNTNWDAVPPEGFVSRGSGNPYLAGLIRPWELAKGKINHAIAFAVNYPSKFHVYPATKSDGSELPPALPEGARLQLDPTLTEEDFNNWGLNREGKIIARALQEYGMILTDGSGHPKISIEYEGTAHWGELLTKDVVKNIPYSEFKLLNLKAPSQPAPPEKLRAGRKNKGLILRWSQSPSATRYRVKQREIGTDTFKLLDAWVTATQFLKKKADKHRNYEYAVVGISHNGVSEPRTIQLQKTSN